MSCLFVQNGTGYTPYTEYAFSYCACCLYMFIDTPMIQGIFLWHDPSSVTDDQDVASRSITTPTGSSLSAEQKERVNCRLLYVCGWTPFCSVVFSIANPSIHKKLEDNAKEKGTGLSGGCHFKLTATDLICFGWPWMALAIDTVFIPFIWKIFIPSPPFFFIESPITRPPSLRDAASGLLVNGPQTSHIWRFSSQLCASVTCHEIPKNANGLLYSAEPFFKFRFLYCQRIWYSMLQQYSWMLGTYSKRANKKEQFSINTERPLVVNNFKICESFTM